MTALSAARVMKRRGIAEQQRTHKMVASTQIWAGSLIMVDPATGLAKPCVAAPGAAGGSILGVATRSVLSTASGGERIWFETGSFLFDAVSIAETQNGAPMYATDDHTFDDVQGSHQVQIGILEEYVSATSGWVKVGQEFCTNPVAA